MPQALGKRRPIDVTRAMYDGRMSQRRLEELAPLVFAAAADGDAVARAIVDRLADELAVMAVAIARRLRVARREVDVVLTGGVFRTEEPGFYARFEERLAPRAAAGSGASPDFAARSSGRRCWASTPWVSPQVGQRSAACDVSSRR